MGVWKCPLGQSDFISSHLLISSKQSKIGDLFALANPLLYNVPSSNHLAALSSITEVSQSDTLF